MPRVSKRRAVKKIEESSSDDDKPLKKKYAENINKMANDLSSESDLDDYLKPANQIDLMSSFFNITPKDKSEPSFEDIEKNILGVDRLSDSESDSDYVKHDGNIPQVVIDNSQPSTSYNFQEIKTYNEKMEEAMKFVEQYKAKQAADNLQVTDLLTIGESMGSFKSSSDNLTQELLSDSENEDWEEVEIIQPEMKDSPKKDIEIVVSTGGMQKKNKKGLDLVMMLRRRLNRIKKEHQVFIHKVSLLCWIAHGNYVNNVLNDQNLLALSLSLLPSQQSYPSERINLKYLEQIVKWYKNFMKINESEEAPNLTLDELLEIQITKKETCSYKYFVYIFVCIIRSLGISCRLIISLQCEPLRPRNSELLTLSTKNNEAQDKNNEAQDNTKERVKASSKQTAAKSSVKKEDAKVTNKKNLNAKITKKTNKTDLVKKELSEDDCKPSTSKATTSRTKNETATKTNDTKGKVRKSKVNKKAKPQEPSINNSSTSTPIKKPNLTKLTYSVKKPTVVVRKSARNKLNVSKESKQSSKQKEAKNITQLDGQTDSDSDAFTLKKPNLKKLQSVKSPIKTRKKYVKSYAEIGTDDDFVDISPTKLNKSNSSMKLDVRNDIMNLVKKSIVEDNYKLDKNLTKNKRKSLNNEDSDYTPPKVRKLISSENEFKNDVKVKRRVPPKSELNKSDTNKKEDKKKIGTDLWVEVFVEAEEKWISVDVVKGQIHCVKELHGRATQPVSYILGWDNEGHIKDITKRYSTVWNTITRKLRADNIWWSKSLRPFKGPSTIRDKDEDEDLERQQLDQPLPKTISEYKNHPLYVLKRHLLKFQAIYPPDAAVLGFTRNEPVYSRDCVYTLHSRDIWLKQAKVVKLGELPYKIVKARPKYDKLSNKMITDQLLEIFGIWQVQEYEPPTAENGVVPRNAYGNVDLFKSCMLPKGTVHIRLAGLNKIAQKMKIDCAPAVIGFEFHSGWSHPTFDGYVVCKEHEDLVIAGWYMEQEESEKREQEKIDKRVYGNWKRLIKGVLITERFKNKYNIPDKKSKSDKGKKEKRANK